MVPKPFSPVSAAFAAFLALAGLAFAGCSEARPPLRVGVNDWPPCALWAVARQEGYFGRTQVEIVKFTNWSDNVEALYKGNLDFTHSTYLNAISYSGKGEPARIVLSLDTAEGSDGLVVSRRIASGKALLGAKVGVEVDTDEHFLLYKALQSFGLASDSVTIVSSTSMEAAELFAAGKVDAAFTYEPYLSEAAAKGGGRIAWTTRDAPGYVIDVLLARERILSERRGDVRVLAGAWFKALAFAREKPAEARRIMAAFLGQNEKDFGPFFDSFTFFDAEDNRRIFADPAFESKLGEMAAFLGAEGIAGVAKDVRSLYDPSFAASAGSR